MCHHGEHDIDTINDIAEEMARIIGYDQIQISNFSISKKINLIVLQIQNQIE